MRGKHLSEVVLDAESVKSAVAVVAQGFARDRQVRQLRRHLEAEDFQKLADAGFLLTGVPAAMGGLWLDIARSTRTVSELLRTLARGDASVAPVSSMHPAVLSFWLASPRVDSSSQKAWDEQIAWMAQSALDGHFWGTITSEPGSGGDIMRTKTAARPDGERYPLTGAQHLGSGSGV